MFEVLEKKHSEIIKKDFESYFNDYRDTHEEEMEK